MKEKEVLPTDYINAVKRDKHGRPILVKGSTKGEVWTGVLINYDPQNENHVAMSHEYTDPHK